MALVKSKGNMYEWVTHMHTHLAGECPHRCLYCYVQRGPARLGTKYKGALRLVEKELGVNYGKGRVIFIEHMNDLFAEAVPSRYIEAVLNHVAKFDGNAYVFQTKNPGRAFRYRGLFPSIFMLGATIETNRPLAISQAPDPKTRAYGLAGFNDYCGAKTFLTIEPIMDFDVADFLELVRWVNPSFVNIGADSKRCGLPEPPVWKIEALISGLAESGIEIREKHNLARLLGKP